MKFLYISLFLCLLFTCTNDNNQPIENESRKVNQTKEPTVFTEMHPKKTNLYFSNRIVENDEINYFGYTYLYNGGGVALVDINNDGLADVYFTSTQKADKLYLNLGNLKFKDISSTSGIDKFKGCKTGISFTDVNNDGWTDFYVCRAGWSKNPNDRKNLLFLNNQDNTFKESAAEYGVADGSRSIQSVFFDYDNDGDLDMYLSNHPKVFRQSTQEVIAKINNPTDENSDKFYIKNADGTYTESGKKVGIFNHGWGLGLVAADLNNDGWTDVYVSNDFQAHDYYYLNNGDGTFTESLKKYFPHTSYFAMGIDLVDINNDKNLDIFVGEMLSENNARQKTNMAPMDADLFKLLVDSDLHYQYMRNSFHLNNGNGHFSDIADYAGIAKTDWSWSSLFGDYDNDGDNDLLVVNGWLKDTQDKDFSKKANAYAQKYNNKLKYAQVDSFLKSTPLENYAFEYEGDLKFKKVSDKWGFNFKGFSNGMAYGDLDNDGDLDVVVNNMNANTSLYQNNTNGSYLKLKLNGPPKNKLGVNSKITLQTNEGIQYKEFITTRGFQSSCEPMVHFGLKSGTQVESLLVVWPDGKEQIIKQLAINQTHTIDYKDAKKGKAEKKLQDPMFKELNAKKIIDYTHQEIYYNDFAEEVLLPHQLSQMGPALIVGDVDKNGLDDVFIGGAHQQAGALFLQKKPQVFEKSNQSIWLEDAIYEDVDALFFDADGDADLDLYVVSGSNEFLKKTAFLEDRLYLNNGKGQYEKSNNLLPKSFINGGTISSSDFDQDGDQDLFIGGGVLPGKYPQASKSILLQNGSAGFKDVTKELAPELEKAGIIQSSVWSDYNGDGNLDLIVVGEWTSPMFFTNDGTSFILAKIGEVDKMVGWWNKITAVDLDQDGDDDYLLGNLGENYKYKATDEEPFEIFSGDFDENGKQDIVLGYYSGSNLYPVRGLQCSSEQMPELTSQFTTYQAFGNADIFEIYGTELEDALHYKANNFSSVILWNQGNDNFDIQKLPARAQLAPIQDFLIQDFDQDNDLDILMAGNWYVSEVETPRADSGTGLLLTNNENQFSAQPIPQSGFFANRDARKLAYISCGRKYPLVIVANNNSEIQIFQLNKK
jgi:hypothetical protein